MKGIAPMILMTLMAGNVYLTSASMEEGLTCDLLERMKVRKQWQEAFGDGEHRLEFATRLFQRLFKAYPQARELFARHRSDNIYSPQFQAKAQRILNNLGMLISTSDEPEVLRILVLDLREEMWGRANFYQAFQVALMETLADYLQLRMAWDSWLPCLNVIIDILTWN